jgi:hypothetical protein
MDERLAEDVLDRAGQGLGPVEHGEDGLGDIQATVAQPGDQVRDQGGVLGRALLHRERVLGPVDADAQGDDAGVPAEVHPVDHERDQVQVIQPPGHQLSQGGLGRGDEPPRHRRLRRGSGRLLHRLPGGLQPGAVAARRQARQHLLQRHLPEDLSGGEHVIRRQAQLAGAVRGPHPGPGHRDPPAAQGDRPGPGAVPVPGPVWVVLALRPAQAGRVLVEHGGHHLQAGAHGQGQQALLRRFGDLGHRHDHLLRHGDLARLPVRLGTAAVLLVGVAHGGPLPLSDDLAIARHLPLGRPRAGDRHSQVLRRPGHPLGRYGTEVQQPYGSQATPDDYYRRCWLRCLPLRSIAPTAQTWRSCARAVGATSCRGQVQQP